MTDRETLAERLRTVERAVTDGTTEFPAVTELAEVEQRLETVEQRVDDIDEQMAELDAATQALRGYVGNIRSVNEDIEHRANAALAATDRLEARLNAEVATGRESNRGEQPPRQQQAGSTGTPGSAESGSGQAAGTATTGLAAEEDSGFAAITDGGGPEDGEDSDEGVLGRIRGLL